jgi:RNase P subunit RPR2
MDGKKLKEKMCVTNAHRRRGMTTTAQGATLCGYCGNWHTYSYEMCKDMHNRPVFPATGGSSVCNFFTQEYVDKLKADHLAALAEKDARIKELEAANYQMAMDRAAAERKVIILTEGYEWGFCKECERIKELEDLVPFDLTQEVTAQKEGYDSQGMYGCL